LKEKGKMGNALKGYGGPISGKGKKVKERSIGEDLEKPLKFNSRKK